MTWQVELTEDAPCLKQVRHGVSFRWSRCLLDLSGVAAPSCTSLALSEIRPEDHGFSAGGRLEGIGAEVSLTCGDRVSVTGSLQNGATVPLVLHTLRIRLDPVDLGSADDTHIAVFKNGYQSWTATRSFSSRDKEHSPWLRWARLMQDNLANLPTCRRGEFTSDMFSLLGDNHLRRYLLVGQCKGFEQFVYIRSSIRPGDPRPSLEVVLDFGGCQLASGATIDFDGLTLIADTHPNRALEAYLDLIGVDRARAGEHPVGWCSWYYYYTRVKEADLLENLHSATRHGIDWHYFQLDDGYQTAVGDWLSINRKFGRGLEPLVREIRSASLEAGLWMAPFLASRRSKLFKAHPEWCLKDADGSPLSAGLNPLWGLPGRIYALDATHPGLQEYLGEVVRTLVHSIGFRFLKLDFLYAACLDGRAHDPTVSPAGRLKLGYSVIRQAAGDDVFLLGCGAPLAPSIGSVDGMRIGPDVAAFWFPTLRYHLTRDPHALCARFAVRNMLNRAQLHGKLWLNDPDCLLIRDTETRLTATERETLANAIIITGGLLLISDRLSGWSPELWEKLEVIERHSRACSSGCTWPLDFMERETAEVVFNTAGYLALFNFSDRPRPIRVPFSPLFEGLLERDALFTSVWDGRRFGFEGSLLDVGELAPHGSLLLARDV